MTKQWNLIFAIWLGVAIAAVAATVSLEDEAAWTAFSVLMAGAIAIVSLVHVLRGSVFGAVREQVYVAAGSFLILSIATVITLVI